MLLITFLHGQQVRIGVLDRGRDEVVDLSAAAPSLPREMLPFIALGTQGLDHAREAADSGRGRMALAEVQILAPIPKPARNLFCIGKNYRAHAAEVQSITSGAGGEDAIPRYPIVFTKSPSSVIGPGMAIPSWLDPTGSVDYEGELAVIIGTGGRGIARDKAMDCVYGYTLLNDVTSRRLQRRHMQWFIGKSLDGFAPMGPAILTADEVPDVGSLKLTTEVNGELRQNGELRDLIFDIPTLIETLSQGMTLEPGDIIATGTPAGVGMGFDPPRFLARGDTVRITVGPIGTLENPVE